MQNEIKNKWFFNQQPQEVWEYLTQAELIAQWLMPNNFKAIVGYEFEFRVNPMPAFNLDGVFYCKVIEMIPYKKLVYSWTGGPEKGVITLDTILEWTLVAKDNGTELHLIQSGFKEQNVSIFSAMFNGWDTNVKKIITLLSQSK